MLVVVGIPVYNEEKNIGKIIVQIKSIVDKIIVCDDGSTDSSAHIAKELGVTVIKHDRNRGYGTAIGSLFAKAREMNADILVTFDGDGQHRVQDIMKVVEPVKNGSADIVIGSRFLGNDETVPNYRKIGIKALTKITNMSLEKKITDSQSGFRAYNKKALNEIIPSESGMGISNEILIKAEKKGFTIHEVPITILYDGDTSTHHPVTHGASVMLSTMKFISIEHPLKFYGIPGILFLGIGLFFIVWSLQIFAQSREVLTNIALIGIGSTIFGGILIMTSILLFSIITVVKESKR